MTTGQDDFAVPLTGLSEPNPLQGTLSPASEHVQRGDVETMKVEILADVVIDQIAAGEVVERPASVVKELVENSLDAQARSIAVILENGGQSLIEVHDDGCGMSRENALVAIRRFGTSKLKSAEDLQEIRTLGFRGEALPSIASVSRFQLLTRAARSDHSDGLPDGPGVEIRIDGGEVTDITEVPASTGTRISVSQLFYNVPARRKFLKTAATETAAVRSLLSDIAAANPQVRFRLVSDGNELLNLPPSASLSNSAFADRVKLLRFAGDDPLQIDETLSSPNGEYRLLGLLSKPRDSVAGANRLRLLVNGRSVRDRLLLRAIRDGYGDFLKGNRYPTGVVSLTVPPHDLDVNVHPQKSEVRFRSADMIFRLSHYAFRRAFQETGLASAALPASERNVAPEIRPEYLPWRNSFERPSSTGPLSETVEVEWRTHSIADQTDKDRHESKSGIDYRLTHRFVGQLFQCYLIFEGEENGTTQSLMVDMHAAHERVTFARLNKQYREQSITSQMLLIPEVIECLPHEQTVYASLEPALKALGFDCEIFGESGIIFRSVPAMLSRMNLRKMIADLFTLEDRNISEKRLDETVERVLARVACHGSVRSGQTLGKDEAFSLLEQLTSVELAPFCPHGRPVMVELTRTTIESFFGRST